MESVKSLIDNLAEKGLIREITARLFQVKAATRLEYELQVKALFYAGPLYAKYEGLRRFDYNDLLNLLRNFEHDLDKKFYGKDEDAFNMFIAERFEAAGYPYHFEHELAYHAKKNSFSISIPKERLTKLQVHYFNEYIKQAGLTEDAVHMFYWTSTEKLITITSDSHLGRNLRFIEPQMVTAVKEALQTYDPAIFLKFTIEYDTRDVGVYKIYREIPDMFTTPSEWRALVESCSNLHAEVKEEYLSFFDAQEEKGFGNWTEFTFHTLLKRP